MSEDCWICNDTNVSLYVNTLKDDGWGYKRIYRELRSRGIGTQTGGRLRDQVQFHVSQCVGRTVMSAIGDAEDNAERIVSEDYFEKRGIDMPPEGVNWVAATVEENGPDGQRHWIRIKPENPIEEDRIEIRQAEPVTVEGRRPGGLHVFIRSNWRTYMVNPDCQIGYFRDLNGTWHTTHDERCFDIGHQVAYAVAEDDGLDGWFDVGDFADLAAASRWNPTQTDLHVEGLNKTMIRGSEEMARRRWAVGDRGEVVIMAGNHDIRLKTKANQEMPYLVGLRRAGDPEDEHPILSVPFLMRARDYGVEWVNSWPSGYRLLNSNLVITHSPAYGSKALDTARKISEMIHVSVIFGHTHRREALAKNIETIQGARTLELWSDGCWARTDGALPSQRNTFDNSMDRLTRDDLPDKVGIIGENFHQGFSIVHVEIGGRERFSAERVAIWDGFAQFRGTTFTSSCDAEGTTLQQEAA